MVVYRPPVRDMRFALEALDYEQVSKLEAFQDYDLETVIALAEQAGQFASQTLLPLNAKGDEEGLKWDPETGAVTLPDGFKEAQKAVAEQGYVGIHGDVEYGGGGAPEVAVIAMGEMQSACNRSLSMCAGLTRGLIEALHAHGSPEQKTDFMAKLISGEWSGTMCLTEPQCGTDLGLVSTKAIPNDDGNSYKLSGTKIWITFGEHELHDNIVHLVLARLPDAPAGIKGISTFIVPKFTTDGKRNPIKCTGLEHKMGINASPTCVMELEEAEGYLVGQPHRGMKVMFTMMNAARLHVGVEAIAVAEIAYQNCLAFAKDRRQGRSLDKGKNEADAPADNILVHPDVRRMLLNQKATNEALRGLALWTAMQIDIARHGADEQQKQDGADLAALLTPIIKSYATERGTRNVSDAIQVCGGSGYTKDWGIEQFYRDTRITMIYEGTNHVQALDLVGRKLPMHGGRLVELFAARVQDLIKESSSEPKMGEFIAPLGNALKILGAVTKELAVKGMEDREVVGAVASNYLNLFALTALGYVWCTQAKHALKEDTAFNRTKLKTARYFFSNVMPESASLVALIKAGKSSMMEFEAEELETA